jgi:RNA polymerase sigma-70 factor (ECF subfamily)
MRDDVTERVACLYRQVGPTLLAYLRSRHAHAPIAEDLLQDTFVQAMKNPERILNAASPRAYLFGIARHLSQEAFRRQRPEEEMPSEIAAEPAITPDPRLEIMREAIIALPATPREVLLLRLQQELSYEEIAQALHIPIGTVRSRLHQAVQRLRVALQGASHRQGKI